ncbi:mediator complex subunit MED14-domain-containing protein [Cryomyces antarcticus]
MNGLTSQDAHDTATPPSAMELHLQLPPELQQWTDNYLPFGKLLERVSQECVNDLHDAIDELADMQVPQTNAPPTNGINSLVPTNGVGGSSDINDRKKLRLMNFAQNHRDRFIKMLVLSDWSRNVDQVSKLIDLHVWFTSQRAAHDNAAFAMANMKRNMIGAKLPNPDLSTALEALSTGKAPRMPHLGYIPPDPLTPQKILKVLQNMDALLFVRLNLHEDIPPHFRDYSVASGRATFVVPSEFEVDLSIADEDPASPFYFIDIRLLFSPTPDDLSDQVLGQLEHKANEVLRTQGLSGCYDFLHNFVLTYKINVLRRQAYDLCRTTWSDSIRVETVHRSLVVHYWTEVPGGKNWLEIGISSGKRKDSANAFWAGPGTPRITTRWFRNGVEVKDVDLSFDFHTLSMERSLRELIALHTNHSLTIIRDQLLSSPPATKALSVELLNSTSGPATSSLKIQLTPSSTVVAALIDPVSGHLTLRPATVASSQIESDMNRDIAVNPAQAIGYLLCTLAQIEIDRQARRSGWQTLKNVTPSQDNMREHFGNGVVRKIFFRGIGWGDQWAIAATINLGGEMWWIVEFDLESGRPSIKTAVKVPTEDWRNQPPPITAASLHKIDQASAAIVSFYTMSRELHHLKIRYALRNESRGPKSNGVLSSGGPVLYIRFSDLVPTPQPSDLTPNPRPWACEKLQLTHHGFESSHGKVIHVVKGMVVPSKANDLASVLTNECDEEVAFHRNGGFALLLRSTFGVPFVGQLQNRLVGVNRLHDNIQILKRKNFECKKASLAKVVFSYSQTPDLSATVNFTEDLPMTLELDPGNPHRRISVLLQKLLNNGESGFGRLATALQLTLPLLRVFDTIEGKDSSAVATVHTRSLDWYRISYHAPLPHCSFDVRLRVSKSNTATKGKIEMSWQISDHHNSSDQRSAELSAALKTLFVEKGDGWTGVITGIVADLTSGAENAIARVDDVVRRHRVSEAAVQETAKADAPASNQPVVVVLD